MTTDVRKIAYKDLSGIVSDADELRKGAQIFDAQGLAHLARFENKLFAEAKGSGAAPYKVQILLEEKPKGRCSCMAARSRPFCKHAAALLVAWSRAPDGFVVSDVAPAAASGGAATSKSVKTGKVDSAALMKGGVEQVSTLVKELALSGVAALGADRAEQIRVLGEGLRESRLRRLSARVISLADAVNDAAVSHHTFDSAAYAELFSDLVLTVRKLEKHLGGEVLDNKYVEELIGKTWTKKDRAPVQGLELIEYAFISRTTADDFSIRESRLFDVASGEHYSEKQILPAFLVARTEPKRSHSGSLLQGAAGSIYPSFSPVRVDLESTGTLVPLQSAESTALQKLIERAIPSVSAALVAFQERRKDVFAPDLLPVAIAVDTVLADGTRLQVVDQEGGALFLPVDPAIDEALASALREVKLKAVLGDVTIDGALPTIFPLAVVVDDAGRLELRMLGAADANGIRETRKVKISNASTRKTGAEAESWSVIARSVGASTAAIALGEVRDELAHALVTGLASLVPRFTDPLVARLTELGLQKQAQLLDATAKKPDAAERLDDVVKLYQVLGIALTRLVGAAHVDKSALISVPTFESVQVKTSAERLNPAQAAERVGSGALNRYQAAVHYAAWFDDISPESLAKNIYPAWADGSISHFVARVFAKHPDIAVAAASRVLALNTKTAEEYVRHQFGAMAQRTAIRVLEAVGGPEAEKALRTMVNHEAKRHNDLRATLASLARRSLRTLEQRRGLNAAPMDTQDFKNLEALTTALLSASDKGARMHAARELAQRAYLEAIPALRASMLGDVSADVREASAISLALIGDSELVGRMITALAQRAENPSAAKKAIAVLGALGDVRAVPALVEAWANGYQPLLIGDALRFMGPPASSAMIDRVLREPELIKKKASKDVIVTMPVDDVVSVLSERLDAVSATPSFVDDAALLVKMVAGHGPIGAAVAEKVLSLRPGIAEASASKAERALFKAVGALRSKA